MSDVQVLVDFENVQPTLEALQRLAPGLSSLWLFHGPHQTKLAQQFKAEHEHVTLVPISRTGKNALDFHLSFYLGYVAARHPDAKLVVVANDKGYDPMILHASSLGFDVKRLDTKARPAAAKGRAKSPAAAKSAKPAAKQAAKSKAPAAAAKAQAAATKAPTAPPKAVPAKSPARKQAAAKAPAPEKAQAKAASRQPATATGKAASPKANAKRTPATALARAKATLAKMGERRPEKLKSLLRHLSSMLGKDATPEAVQDLVHQLAQAGVIRVSVDGVSYRDA